MPTVVERIAEYANGLTYEDIDATTRDYAKRVLLDALGCAFGAIEGEPVRIVRRVVKELGGSPQATLIGQGQKTSTHLAALANGVAIRYLDFNDVYFGPAWTAHPSDATGSLLAVAESQGRSGRDLLTALVLTYEIQMRFSDLPVARNLWHEGWDHSCSCAYASATGVAKLLGLDTQRIAHAIALSGARANTLSEIRVGDIPMDKALSAPAAAANSVLYGLLAKEGFTGCSTLLEGRFGFKNAVAKGADVEPLVPEKGVFLINKVGLKPYPVEGMTIAMVQAGVEVGIENKIKPEEIEAVKIITHEEALTKPSWGPKKLRPTSKETADHSFPYCVAVALVAGECTPEQFSQRWLNDATVARLISITTMVSTPEMSAIYKRGHRPAAVEVTTRRGSFIKDIPYPTGDPKNPMPWGQVVKKFFPMAATVIGKEKAERCVAKIEKLEEMKNVAELAELISGR
jgi:2-methylcitrate dehydratase